MPTTTRSEIGYKEFCTQWGNDVTKASTGDPMAMLMMNLGVKV